MKGYMIVNTNWKCRDKEYTCPNIFSIPCKTKQDYILNGIPFYITVNEAFYFSTLYPKDLHIIEVESLGKTCIRPFENIFNNANEFYTDKIKTLKVLSNNEVASLLDSKVIIDYIEFLCDQMHKATDMQEKLDIFIQANNLKYVIKYFKPEIHDSDKIRISKLKLNNLL